MLLAAGLLTLGAAARLGCGPGPDDFSWSEAARAPGPRSAGLSATRQHVSDGVAEEEAAATPLAEHERIDPNQAPVSQLRRLPGVGPARARAIVRERESGGPFRVLADLERVPGIGSRTVEALEPHLRLGGRSSATGPVAGLRAPDAPIPPVNVNRAQIKELEQITGIGPALAARIIETRQRYGPFRGADDLLQVPGIGPAVLQRIRPQVRF
jgi:competence protein ComEA